MKARILSVTGETHRYSEDFYCVKFSEGRLKVALGDWAPNLLGETYQDAEVAKALGVPEGEKFNGGVIGAHIARNLITSTDTTGYDLIKMIELYRMPGIILKKLLEMP